MRPMIGAAVAFLMLAACGDSVESETELDNPQKISAAEAFIDAFYSFNQVALEVTLSSAEESIPSIVFYQGWAEGGNYEIVDRMPCEVRSVELISCSITVKDDLIGALGVDFNVTDTFHLTFSDGSIVSVETSSNDPQVFYDAENWVRENRAELIREPCRGYRDGGPTPGKCVQAMVQGYAEFTTSDDSTGAL